MKILDRDKSEMVDESEIVDLFLTYRLLSKVSTCNLSNLYTSMSTFCAVLSNHDEQYYWYIWQFKCHYFDLETQQTMRTFV